MIREFFSDWKRWSFATARWNLRFTLGYRIGRFTSAKRSEGYVEGKLGRQISKQTG